MLSALVCRHILAAVIAPKSALRRLSFLDLKITLRLSSPTLLIRSVM